MFFFFYRFDIGYIDLFFIYLFIFGENVEFYKVMLKFREEGVLR